jgi:glucose-1-phosphate adenylyltransferase
VIESGAEVSESVLMNGVRVGCGARVRRTLIDKSTSIPAGEVIGYDTEADRRRFLVTENGIVVIPRDFVFA